LQPKTSFSLKVLPQHQRLNTLLLLVARALRLGVARVLVDLGLLLGFLFLLGLR
jgi:hypothetical protein